MDRGSPGFATPGRRGLWTALATLVPVVALPLCWPPNGKDNAAMAQFLGRFHTVLLHLPIGFLALVALMELLTFTRRFAHLRASAGFVLGVSTIGAFVSTLTGWLLAWGGGSGYDSDLLSLHMNGALVMCGMCVVTVAARLPYARRGPHGPGVAYLPLLLATMALLVFVGHQGGSLTHGESFLTQHMPNRLRSLLGMPNKEPGASASRPSTERTSLSGDPVPASTRRVAPATGPAHADEPLTWDGTIAAIVQAKCVQCHKPGKKKGELLMDSYANLMLGGENGPILEPGKPDQSEMYRRITLPPDDDDFMPSDGKPVLTAAEVKLIERWIAGGAKEK